MTGDLVSGEKAERIGLINHVVDGGDLDAAVDKMARKLAAGPQIALRFNKRLVNKELEERVSRLYDLSLALDQDLGLSQRIEDLAVQKLVPEAGIEVECPH